MKPSLTLLTALLLAPLTMQAAKHPATHTPARSEDRLMIRSPQAEEAYQRIAWDRLDGCAHIRGFNYQPSWGSNGIEIWLDRFDAKKFRFELERGKELFPSFNCVRLWLSKSAYEKNPNLFLSNFDAALGICHDLDLLVITILFTRWAGQPPFDHVLVKQLLSDAFMKFAGGYIDAVVGRHCANRNILAWDLCNEPILKKPKNLNTDEGQAERKFLQFAHARVKQTAPDVKTCVGTLSDFGLGKLDEPLCDILTPHIYQPQRVESQEHFDAGVAIYMKDLQQRGVNKPVLSSETCWGSLDDMKRKEIIRVSLTALTRHKIGFLAHALYTSPLADLHPLDMGEVHELGYMAYIRLDGSLRPGHEIFNEFCDKNK